MRNLTKARSRKVSLRVGNYTRLKNTSDDKLKVSNVFNSSAIMHKERSVVVMRWFGSPSVSCLKSSAWVSAAL